jgi:hypothetical protein
LELKTWDGIATLLYVSLRFITEIKMPHSKGELLIGIALFILFCPLVSQSVLVCQTGFIVDNNR